MAAESATRTKTFVLLNAGSGNSAPDAIRDCLSRLAEETGIEIEVRRTEPNEKLRDVVEEALRDGYRRIVAAGGDGTVSAVADALVGKGAELGIVPLGTTNVFARELGIPLDADDACRLLAGPVRTVDVDAMRIDRVHYFTQIGAGVDALMIRDTTTESKKRFGLLAYLWTGLVRLAGFERRRFRVVADDVAAEHRASQVMIVNSGTLGASGLRWTPDAGVNDGRVEVCLFRAGTAVDYLALAWTLLRGRKGDPRKVVYLKAERFVTIESDRPMPVQADGEVVGKTPVRVEIAPAALRVLVPIPVPTAED